MAWVPFLLLGVTLTILGLDPWLARARALPAADPDEVPDEVAARRGSATARWLYQTRVLRRGVLALEARADRLHVRELERAGEPRTVGRQIDDTDLAARLRSARLGAQAWLAAARALPGSERRALAELDIDPEALAEGFALPWSTDPVHERRCDRSGEIARIREDCRSLAHQLLRIDQCLRASADAPYRGG
ncbi:MAG TPA: hypothetical protein VFG69_11600 [Nannocystaceae bacterium]|nr:hypothetical protein [Nannocystaceae bacterium]